MRAIPGLPASRTARALWLVVALVAVALVAVALVSTVRAGDDEPSETAQYITGVNRGSGHDRAAAREGEPELPPLP